MKKFVGAASGVAVVVLLAGCGSSGGPTVSAPSATGTASSGGYGGRTFRRPGVSGVIASRTGTTAQVTTTSGTTSTVSWKSATSIVQEQPATSAALHDGACVSVRPQGFGGFGGRAGAGQSGDASAMPTHHPSGTRPSGTFTMPSTITATSVTVEPAGACHGNTGVTGFAGGFGGFSGTVSKLSSSGFTMTVTARRRASGASSGAGAATPAAPRAVAVATGSSTTYTRDVAGSTASVRAGECLTALGTQSGSTLAARQITVSQSVNGTCDSGFGFGGGRGSGGSGGGDA